MVKAQPMLRFQLREQLPAHLLFVAANIGIIVILMIVAQFMTGDDVTGSYTSIGLSAGIYMTVAGNLPQPLLSGFCPIFHHHLLCPGSNDRGRAQRFQCCHHFYQNVSFCRLVFCPLSH